MKSKFLQIIKQYSEQYKKPDEWYIIEDRILYVYMDWSCLNNCIFCPQKFEINEFSFDNLVSMKLDFSLFDEAYLMWEDVIVLKDIIKITEYISVKWKSINLISSLNMIDKSLIDKLLKYNIKSINISIHWPRKIHDEVTWVKWNYDSMIWLIEHIQIRKPDVKFYSISLLLKQNIAYINETIKIAKKYSIKQIYLFPRFKTIISKCNYMPSYKDIINYLQNKNIYIIWVPLCIIKRLNIEFINTDITYMLAKWIINNAIYKYNLVIRYSKREDCKKCDYQKKCIWYPLLVDTIYDNRDYLEPIIFSN